MDSPENSVHAIDLDILIRRIFISCLVIMVLLIIADYVFNYRDLFDDRSFRRIWNIAREQSIPSWFSSIQAQLLGVTVFLIAVVEHRSVNTIKTIIWVLIGLFFFWIGIDDYAEIHEKLGGVLERMAKDGEPGAVTGILLKNPSFSWHTFIAPFFAICGLGILAFLWLSFWRLRLLHYVILGFGCWAVAQGLDFVEGLDAADDFYEWVQAQLGVERKYGVTHTFKVVEEVLEMLGTTLLWIGFLKYFAQASDGLQFRLKSSWKI